MARPWSRPGKASLVLLASVLAAGIAAPTAIGVAGAQPAPRGRVLFLRPAGGPQGPPGALLALEPDGSIVVVDEPLADPRGLVVLADGTALVTDGMLGLVVGIGGRFGAGQKVKVIEGLAEPHALVLTPNGDVLVTTLGRGGGVALVDQAARRAAPIATGLGRPVAAALGGGGVLLVADATGGRVVSVPLSGGSPPTPVAEGFGDLVGVAPGPGGSILACDRGSGGVSVVESPGGRTRRLAAVDQPSSMQLLPPDPTTGVAYLGIPTARGFVAVHPETGASAVIPALSGLGSSFVPPATGALFSPPAALTAAPPATQPLPAPAGQAPGASSPASPADDESGGGLPVAGLVAVLAIAASGVGAGLAIRRRRTGRAGPVGGPRGPAVARSADGSDPAARLDALRRAQAAWERYLELQRRLQALRDEHAELMKGDDAAKQIATEKEIARLEAESKAARDEMTEARGAVGSVPAKELQEAEAAAERAKAEAAKAPPAGPASPPPVPTRPDRGKPDPRGVSAPPCTDGAEQRTTTKQATFVVAKGQPKVRLSPQIARGRLSPEAFRALLEAAGVAAEVLETLDEVLGWASYAGVPAPAAIGQAAEGLRALSAGLGAITKAGAGILERLPNLWDLSITVDQEQVTCRCEHLTICKGGTWIDGGTTLSRSTAPAAGWSVSATAASLAEVAAKLDSAAARMDQLTTDSGSAEAFACP